MREHVEITEKTSFALRVRRRAPKIQKDTRFDGAVVKKSRRDF